MRLYLFEPVGNIVEGQFLGAVKNKNDAHSAFVVSLRNGAEALLAGGIPDLKLYSLVVHRDRLNFEVNA